MALIFAIDFDELSSELQLLCRDTSQWAFITNGSLKGVYCEIYNDNDLRKILPLLQVAYEQAL